MAAAALKRIYLEKPWGRRDLPESFKDSPCRDRLGEVWFESGAKQDALLVKYLFTSERLSIQVHPDAAGAGRLGLPFGKDEAWIILDAQPGARIGLGLKRPVSRDELRSAAQSGAIEELIDWRPVRAGDFVYSPAGTIHALGPGLTLVEVQQNIDVTYRLYDYGRPRELHLDQAIAAADLAPFRHNPRAETLNPHRQVLAQGARFVVERWTGGDKLIDAGDAAPVWLVPLGAATRAGLDRLEAGQVYLIREPTRVRTASELLIAYDGPTVRFAADWSGRRAA